MSKTLKKKIKTFLKDVESNLFCSKEEKKKILTSLKNDINIQVEDGTISAISDIIEIFGTPESIASSYQINPNDVVKLRSTRKVVLKAIIVSLAIIVALLITSISFVLLRAELSGKRYRFIDLHSVSSVTAPPKTN